MKKTVITKESLLDSYERLEKRAEYDFDYIFFTASAAAICSFGFRMNSPSVIVGAMVVSPLLFSVVSAGASAYWRKWDTFLSNIKTLLLGVMIAVIVSSFINLFFPTANGSEIISRIASSPMDYLFVAVFSGLAGTFAFFWPDIVEAIAGIAISVALIPPVVMIGIGLATQNVVLFSVSALIAIINIGGILLGSLIGVYGLNLYAKRGSH